MMIKKKQKLRENQNKTYPTLIYDVPCSEGSPRCLGKYHEDIDHPLHMCSHCRRFIKNFKPSPIDELNRIVESIRI